MLIIELSAYALLSVAVCEEFHPILSAEHFVANLEEAESVREALGAYRAQLYLAQRWCERRSREANEEFDALQRGATKSKSE